MRNVRLNLFIVVLLTLSIFACIPSSSIDFSGDNSSFSMEPVDFESQQREATLAAAYWSKAPEPIAGDVTIDLSSGNLHVVTGTHDPLVDIPLIPMSLRNMGAPSENQIYIVQLHTNDAEEMYHLSEIHNLELLDVLPDTAWVVRLPSNADEVLSVLEMEDSVRWAGPQHPAWKLDSYWLKHLDDELSGSELTFIPTPDLNEVRLSELRTEVNDFNTDFINCDPWLCQVSLSVDTPISPLLNWLAHDERVLYVGRSIQLELTNYYAANTSGITATKLWNGGLDGTGEVVSISDTGLDSDHGDFGTRVISIHSNFAIDTSTADANSGHGTHVAATLLGDGSGDSNAQGVAPEASLHMYQLESDLYGVIVRMDSMYNMLKDAHTFGARLQSISWADGVGIGEYTSDSRSADMFLNDYQDFVGVFSVGNNMSGQSSTIAPPSTAKNTLSIGSSTSGSPGTPAVGAVDSKSAIGPTLDGRIKPDLVAPGVSLCSARAQEAIHSVGTSCSSAVHPDGSEKYMALTGASQATPVASGAALLVRQFMREEHTLVAESDLIRAILINGATDLGTPDIPNPSEGWGQLDLEQSLNPKYQGANLNMWYDSSRSLFPGKSLLYTYDFDISTGLDITLVWNDLAGSASAASTAPRLVNNLNLKLISPDGTEFNGNVFSNGFSTVGGTNDVLNNVERIKLSPGQISSTGLWTVEVSHAGGAEQEFSIVISGSGSSSPQPDLTVDSSSIWISSPSPLVNEILLIRTSWFNQGTAPTGTYRVSLTDTTTGVELSNMSMGTLVGGDFDTVQITHNFVQTGLHILKLRLDVMNSVTEINDYDAGVNNNEFELQVNIAAEGIRIIPLMVDGSIPISSELSLASQRNLDPLSETQKTFDIHLQHEGTGSEAIQFTVSPVLGYDPSRPNMLLPTTDSWSYEINETSPFVMPPAGTEGSTKKLSITLNNLDADLESDMIASAGIVIVDVTAKYQNDPLVTHTVRLRVDIDRIDDVTVLLAGTNSATAQPNHWAKFTYSVMNSGNALATFKLECTSANNWNVRVGDSTTNSITFEPLSQGQGLPKVVKVRIPPVIDSSPAAGVTDTISCLTTSLDDVELQHFEQITVVVDPLVDFTVDITDQFGDLFGISSLAPDRIVSNGDRFNLTLSIVNIGNVELDLDIKAQQSDSLWWMNLQYGDLSDSNSLSINIDSSQTATLLLDISVPIVAEMGSVNEIVFTVKNNMGIIKTNTTTFRLGEIIDLRLDVPDSPSIQVNLGDGGLFELEVQNHGNTDIEIEWTLNDYPNDWNVSFYSNPPLFMTMQTELSLGIFVSVPAGTVNGLAGEVRLNALITSPSGLNETVNMTLPVFIAKTCWLVLNTDDTSLLELVRETEFSNSMAIRNDGNSLCQYSLTSEMPIGWTITLETSKLIDLQPGQSVDIIYSIMPGDDAESGLGELVIGVEHSGNNPDDIVVYSEGLTITISSTSSKQSSGLFGSLSPTASIGAFFSLIVIVILVVIVVRRVGITSSNEDTQLVAIDTITSMSDIESRRDLVMSAGDTEENHVSGSVSASEITAALHQSSSALPGTKSSTKEIPMGLPPLGKVPKGSPPPIAAPPVDAFATNNGPPLPPTGLPSGWTIDQWKHYGQAWLNQQNK